MPNANSDFFLNNISKAYMLFEQAVIDEDSNPLAAEDMLNKIMPALMNASGPIIGEADDFHNFSVAVLKRFDDYRVAMDIVEMGLKAYPANTDLLADAIKYSTNCAQREAAGKYYQELSSISKAKWTWRSFSFSIDFLLGQYLEGKNYSLKNGPTEALDLVKEYKYYFPNREDPWKCEEDIYSKTNNIAKSIEVLREAISKHNLCPKCWLRYADLMVDRGDYTEAAIYIKKLATNPISAESVNMAYVFYLDGLCRMTAWQQTDEYQEEEFDEKTVLAIYRRFRKAVNHSDCRHNLREKILNLARTIYHETGIPANIQGVDE